MKRNEYAKTDEELRAEGKEPPGDSESITPTHSDWSWLDLLETRLIKIDKLVVFDWREVAEVEFPQQGLDHGGTTRSSYGTF